MPTIQEQMAAMQKLAGRAADRKPRHALPCIALGPEVERAHCNCRRNDSRTCLKGKGVVTQNGQCETCTDYEPQADEDEPERWRIPNDGLGGRADSWRFNGGAIMFAGRLWLCYRTGWAGAQIHLSELDPGSWAVKRTQTLTRCRHRLANYGREDPRLFVYKNALHVSYVGVEQGPGVFKTNMLYARINHETMRVEKVYAPRPADTDPNRWEKNWAFFEWSDRLFFVYSIDPHVVYEVQGERIVNRWETPRTLPWSGGYLRGGASPVLHNGVFYHWFHGAHDLGASWPIRRYNVGVYTFEAAPPFKMLSLTPYPLYEADHDTRPADQYCSVIFPCGAFVNPSGEWVVTNGVHDRWLERHTYPLGVPRV